MEFQTIYKNGITKETIANAIAEYQNTLITPNSKFDKYLRGNINILSQKEIEGFILFKKYGCISCHNGVNVGGNLIQKIGMFIEHQKLVFEDFWLFLRSLSYIGSSGRLVGRISQVSSKSA